MKKPLLIAAIAALGVAGAAAATEFAEVDTDGNGLLSLQEVQAIANDVTQDQFDIYDGDSDGGLDEQEFTLWETATGQPQPNLALAPT